MEKEYRGLLLKYFMGAEDEREMLEEMLEVPLVRKKIIQQIVKNEDLFIVLMHELDADIQMAAYEHLSGELPEDKLLELIFNENISNALTIKMALSLKSPKNIKKVFKYICDISDNDGVTVQLISRIDDSKFLCKYILKHMMLIKKDGIIKHIFAKLSENQKKSIIREIAINEAIYIADFGIFGEIMEDSSFINELMQNCSKNMISKIVKYCNNQEILLSLLLNPQYSNLSYLLEVSFGKLLSSQSALEEFIARSVNETEYYCNKAISEITSLEALIRISSDPKKIPFICKRFQELGGKVIFQLP